MGFGQVITRIDNPTYNTVCEQLKLEDVFNPDKQIADTLVDTIEGYKRARQATELSGDLYFFKFQVLSNTEKKLDALDLPKETQIVCISRGDKAYLASNFEMLKEDDIVTLITKQDKIAMLSEKFGLPKQTKTENNGE